jgi:hypothetical protein
MESSISDDEVPVEHFHPFAAWSGHFTGVGFMGTWVDNNRHGTFTGNYYDPAQPPAASTERVSIGHWYMYLDSGKQIEMGTYILHMDVCTDGDAYGTWLVTNPDWTGSGAMTGHDPNVPPPLDGE